MIERQVYFLRPVGREGPVKIGSSCTPRDRLATYMEWSPIPLELAAKIPGSYTDESRFHARFAAQHSHHEWFHGSPELTATIDAINRGEFSLDSLPGAEGSVRSVRATVAHALRRQRLSKAAA